MLQRWSMIHNRLLSEDFCGMSYEPGKSLHQPPWAMRPTLRPAGIDKIAKVDTLIFPTLLTLILYFPARRSAVPPWPPLVDSAHSDGSCRHAAKMHGVYLLWIVFHHCSILIQRTTAYAASSVSKATCFFLFRYLN